MVKKSQGVVLPELLLTHISHEHYVNFDNN